MTTRQDKSTRLPRVIYWTNQPTPYSVGRLNAVHATGNIDLEVWFDYRRTPDRSWVIDTSTMHFRHRWVPRLRWAPSRATVPVTLLRNSDADLIVQLFDEPHTAVGCVVACHYIPRVSFRLLPAYRSWGSDTPLSRAAKRFLFRSVDAAKVPGPTAVARAELFGLAPDRAFRVTQSIDVALYAGDERVRKKGSALRAELGLEAFTFFYVGRLVSEKGVYFLLEAFRAVVEGGFDAALVIAGDGPEESKLRRLACGTRNVHFVGFVQASEIPAWYSAADALVFPTLGDPHGLVVEEAMAAGLPIITTSAAGDIEARVAGRSAGQVVPPSDSAALAEAMKRLLAAPGSARAIGEANRAKVRDLTHDHYARDFIAFVRFVQGLDTRDTLSRRIASGLGLGLSGPLRWLEQEPPEPSAPLS